MDLQLKGKRAFVSGSTSGIGLEIAKALYAEGCNIAVNGRRPEIVDSIAAGLSALPLSADVTDISECKSCAEKIQNSWQGLDFLVCNVGSGKSLPAGEETSEEWQRLIGINLFSATNLIEVFRPLFPPSGGSIVCISSICGIETLAAPTAYSAAKAALNAAVSSLARPLARQGIRINAIAPGNILFEGGSWERKRSQNRTSVEEMLQREVSLNRFGTPEEIANFALFLLSSKSSFATGAVFTVDGGQCRSY